MADAIGSEPVARKGVRVRISPVAPGFIIMSNLRIDCQSESGTSHNPARVLIYEGDRLVAEVVATIEPKQGADGGYYRCVVLTKKDL